MADADVDIAALSEEQQLALQQFTAVTDQDLAAAVPLLQRCQWNVQIAIARFFDGEPAEDPVALAATQSAPQDIRRQETLMAGFSSPSLSSSSTRGPRLEPAPRVVPQPEGQTTTQAPFVLTVLLAPVSLLYSLLSRYFRFMGWMLPFIPRTWGRLTASNIAQPASRRGTSGRTRLNPRDTAARFIRVFEEDYGTNNLPFFEGGYAQAFDLAKKNLQFLVVVLVSPEHDETASFIRETLLDTSVVDFLRAPDNNLLLWAGSVQDAEAYQVSSALNCTKFPFTGLIVHTPQISSTAMGIAARIAGPVPPTEFIAKIRAAMQTHSAALARVRAQRDEQQATRSIRSQQDSAYERSLAVDRERARLKREEAARAEAAEKEALAAAEAAQLHAAKRAHWRRWRKTQLAPEPAQDAPDVVRISLRLPSAERIVRRFPADADVEELYAFVECYEPEPESDANADADADADAGPAPPTSPPADYTHSYAFRLVSPMPREVFDVNVPGSLKTRIGRSGNLIVERDEGDSESESGSGNEEEEKGEDARLST
jgi:FAS-associated factor 2